ncbi:hypothetical protein EON64_10305 [archaeon]|nr:MAG: hypothetical protein EON64_10305 [archaeon]
MSSSSTLFKVGATTAVALGAAVAYYYLSQVYNNQSSHSTENTEKKSEKIEFSVKQLPVIELSAFFAKDVDPESYEAECKKVASSLHHFGLVVLKDPRVSEADNERFLNMMERYFAISDGIRDARPDAAYQVGVTGEKIEKARDHVQTMEKIKGDKNKPQSPMKPVFDSKWRFFWRIGPRPARTEFPVQNLEPVIPPEFPEWKTVSARYCLLVSYDGYAVLFRE